MRTFRDKMDTLTCVERSSPPDVDAMASARRETIRPVKSHKFLACLGLAVLWLPVSGFAQTPGGEPPGGEPPGAEPPITVQPPPIAGQPWVPGQTPIAGLTPLAVPQPAEKFVFTPSLSIA